MNNETVTIDISISYGLCRKLMNILKNIFSSEVTNEHIENYVNNIDEIIDERVDRQLDNKIRSSNVATKQDIESVRNDMSKDILLLDQKVETRIYQSRNATMIYMTALIGVAVTILLCKLK